MPVFNKENEKIEFMVTSFSDISNKSAKTLGKVFEFAITHCPEARQICLSFLKKLTKNK